MLQRGVDGMKPQSVHFSPHAIENEGGGGEVERKDFFQIADVLEVMEYQVK